MRTLYLVASAKSNSDANVFKNDRFPSLTIICITVMYAQYNVSQLYSVSSPHSCESCGWYTLHNSIVHVSMNVSTEQ